MTLFSIVRRGGAHRKKVWAAPGRLRSNWHGVYKMYEPSPAYGEAPHLRTLSWYSAYVVRGILNRVVSSAKHEAFHESLRTWYGAQLCFPCFHERRFALLGAIFRWCSNHLHTTYGSLFSYPFGVPAHDFDRLVFRRGGECQLLVSEYDERFFDTAE